MKNPCSGSKQFLFRNISRTTLAPGPAPSRSARRSPRQPRPRARRHGGVPLCCAFRVRPARRRHPPRRRVRRLDHRASTAARTRARQSTKNRPPFTQGSLLPSTSQPTSRFFSSFVSNGQGVLVATGEPTLLAVPSLKQQVSGKLIRALLLLLPCSAALRTALFLPWRAQDRHRHFSVAKQHG